MKSVMHTVMKVLAWTVAALVALVLLVPVLLYVPVVQDFVVDIAEREAGKATGMEIDIGRFRLRWPLRLSVEDALVKTAPTDTMLMAGRLDVGVSMLPLLRGRVDVNYLRLDSARYRMGSPDSAIWLRAELDRLDLDASRLTMRMDSIDISGAEIEGLNVRLQVRPDTTAQTDTASASPGPLIVARRLDLRRVRFAMTMSPTIDSLGAEIARLNLSSGRVSMAERRIDVGTLTVDSVSAAYLYPAEPVTDAVAVEKPVTEGASDTAMWVIRGERLRLTARDALYASTPLTPIGKGLNMSRIAVSDVEIEVDSFYNRGADIRVPLKHLSAVEQCGIAMTAAGLVEMAGGRLTVSHFNLLTNSGTRLRLSGMMGLDGLTTNPQTPLELNLTGAVELNDAVTLFPTLRPTVMQLPVPRRLTADIRIQGRSGSIDVDQAEIAYPGLVNLTAHGIVDNPFDAKRIGGTLTLDGTVRNSRGVVSRLMDALLGNTLSLPQLLALQGTVTYSPGAVRGKMDIKADDGHLALTGNWTARSEGYDADVRIDRFPVDAFMPKLGLADLTADITVHGRGYNPLRSGTTLAADVIVRSADYRGHLYQGIELNANLSEGRMEGFVTSTNQEADLDLDFECLMGRDSTLSWDVHGDIGRLNLLALGLTQDSISGGMTVKSRGVMNTATGAIDGTVALDYIDWTLPGGMTLHTGLTRLNARMNDSLLSATLTNGDLRAGVDIRCGLDTLLHRVTGLDTLLSQMMADKMIDVSRLRDSLPPMRVDLAMGSENVAAQLMQEQGITVRNADVTMDTRPDIRLTAMVRGFERGTTRLDTLNLLMMQKGKYLTYTAHVGNPTGVMDNFAKVDVNGFLGDDRLTALLKQENRQGESGFRLGASVTMRDSVLQLQFVPLNPVIAYKPWTINEDNYIRLNLARKRIDADFTLKNDRSLVRLYTSPQPGDSSRNDINAQIRDIRLQDWLTISPFAPPMTGTLSADIALEQRGTQFQGQGDVTLTDLVYDKQRVGTLRLDLDMSADPRTGATRADIGLAVDSVRAVTLTGLLNDTTRTTPVYLDLKIDRLPLEIVNPFLPADMARLQGALNGNMEVSGEFTRPRLNGYLQFDSTRVTVPMAGATFRFSPAKIPVDSNIVTFDGFAITGANQNPLQITGDVDLRHLFTPRFDLTLTAHEMMLFDSKRARGADIYGKALIDLDAKVQGTTEFMLINANLGLLSGTNATYVMAGGDQTLTSLSSSNSDMVHFVSFADSLGIAKADSIKETSAMMLNASLTIQPGTTLNVDLSPDGQNRVQIQGQGNFDMVMSPLYAEPRLTGRYTISKGFVRYTPPMMSEKYFTFNEGSTVSFTGAMMDPLLNLHAVDVIKANVTQQGQNSRLVNFDVGLDVTGTLNSMDVVFNLSTDDDLTVQNELQGMSAEQRSSQAINLLLYGMYTGPGTKGNASLDANPLYSILEGRVNSWLAQAVPGVDITLGIDQYDRTTDGVTRQTTSYSYEVSKSLFNDRFKILVGGNYSTDANADENFSQNLISNISFEYLLNRSGTMYVRLFRHTGYESILEGEVTQTGVGFVFKRKMNSLRDLFRRSRSPEPKTQEKP